MVAVAVSVFLVSTVAAQSLPTTPPSRPRLLFTGADIPAIQARTAVGGSIPAWAYGQMSSTASFQVGSAQATWQVYRSMRFMVENAIKARISNSASSRASALNLLIRGGINAISYLTPTGSNKPYVESTYPCAIATTFDLLYDDLTPAERATIVTELQAWIGALETGQAGPGGFWQYTGATDNQSFSWYTGLIFSYLAIWGEPGVNSATIPQTVETLLARLESGYRDTVSPDGSYDENSGYAHYGAMYSIRAARAAINCGFPDHVGGTNVDNMPRWFGALLMGNGYAWTGDSSPSHRGIEFDPVLYWPVSRGLDALGFWSLERVRAAENISVDTSTFAFSAFMELVMNYPDSATLSPQQPEVLSGFFRDNLNIAPTGAPNWNKLNNNPAIGEGGSAWLHNSPASGWAEFGLHYIIRDEWMNHSHEDDGHVDIMTAGRLLVIDRGYATPGTWNHAQSTHHNIVTVGGQDFLGSGNSHYHAPMPEGRFLGALAGKLLSPTFDYVHGTHEFMWMMERAERTVMLFKDQNAPFAVIMDEVRKDSGTSTYEQRWNTTSAMSGSGTASNPVTVSSSAGSLRATYLEPTSVTVTNGGSGVNSGTAYNANRVLVPGTGDTMILSVWSPNQANSTMPLTAPSANAKGGVLTWPSNLVDKFIAPMDGNPVSDFETSADGAFAWIRSLATGQMTEWAIAEGSSLTHGNDVLLASPEPITCVARDGEIWISRALDATPSTNVPYTTFFVPFTVTRVHYDGADVPFTQTGADVSIGAAPLPPPPPPPPTPPITDDRHYTFTEANLLDGIVDGSVVAFEGGIRAEGGSATFRPLEGRMYPNQPLSISVDVKPLWQGIGGSLGALRLSSPGGNGDLASIELFEAPGNELFTYATHPLAAPTFALVPALTAEGSVRMTVLYDPSTGQVGILDRMGRVVGSALFPPYSGDIEISLVMTETAQYDNFSVYDSAEDGVTPQGTVVWLYPDLRMGFAVQAPTVMASTSLQFFVGSVPLSHLSVLSWLGTFGFQELVVLPQLPAGTVAPLTIREVVFESAMPAVFQTPGIPYIFNVTTAAGVNLSGGAWIKPGS